MDERVTSYSESQPTPVPQMAIASTQVGNRNVKNLPLDIDGKRPWSFGLLSCCGDRGACCYACFCPCLLYGRNQRRLDHLNTKGYPDPRRDEIVIADSSSWLYAVLGVFCRGGWLLQIGARKNIRERYGIRGSDFSDACAGCCCARCDLVQGHRELKLEEDSFQQTY